MSERNTMNNKLKAIFLSATLAAAVSCGGPKAHEKWDDQIEYVDDTKTTPKAVADLPFVGLINQDGAVSKPEDFGKNQLVFFGFTTCPTICPRGMFNIAEGLNEIDADLADDLQVVFITVDPMNDTPARMKEWIKAFDSDYIALTGSGGQLKQVYDLYLSNPGGHHSPWGYLHVNGEYQPRALVQTQKGAEPFIRDVEKGYSGYVPSESYKLSSMNMMQFEKH